MLENSGVPSKEQVKAILPDETRRREGPVVIVECFQEIPCDPCHTACKIGAFLPFADINDLPQLDYESCNGCGICISFCPGLAIFVVDETYSDQEALVIIPWEFLPLPKAGDVVQGVNREGEIVSPVTVKKVSSSAKKKGAHILTLIVPKGLAHEIRAIKKEQVL